MSLVLSRDAPFCYFVLLAMECSRRVVAGEPQENGGRICRKMKS
jgi:hypothetical protein